MKKRYIFGIVVLLILILFFASVICGSNDNNNKYNSTLPRIGEKLWTYNLKNQEWQKYKKYDGDDSENEIVLQVKEPEINAGKTTYSIISENPQVSKDNILIGDNSIEFLKNKKLYSYFPKDFEYYEIIFNGVKFIPKKLSKAEIAKLFKNYTIITVSQLKQKSYKSKLSKKGSNYLILNDIGDDFYQYYIVPNDSKKLEIGEQSNTFKVNEKVDIKIQRLEGCTKTYPCYDISIN